MSIFAAIVLFAHALFNVVAWPRFFSRVRVDSRAHDEQGKATRFLTVHAVLLVIALTLALAGVIAGILVLIF